MELTAAEAWSRILERARPLLPEQTFRIWLEHTEPLALSQDSLAIAAGSDFAAEWIEDKYGDLLTDVAERVFGRAIELSFQHQTREGGARVRVTRAELEPLTAPAQDTHSSSAPAAPLGPPPGGVVFG